ncbi:MAG: HDOD domain-containing protein [bacterium]|nr:HDOD domain-containing protein [bacterium]
MAFELQILDQDLPVLSSVAMRALELSRDDNISYHLIDELIRQDPALTQRVLRVANSPFYAGNSQSLTIANAIVRLGLNQLKSILIIAATGQLFDARDPYIRLLYDHAIASGLGASYIVQGLSRMRTDEAFVGGMLHDVGRMIIYAHFPDIYGKLLDEAKQSHRRVYQLEVENFRYFDHTSIGALAMRKWKLSQVFVEIARYHHLPEKSLPNHLHSMMIISGACLASIVANNLGYGFTVCPWEDVPSMACAKLLHFGSAQIEALKSRVTEAFAVHRAVLT